MKKILFILLAIFLVFSGKSYAAVETATALMQRTPSSSPSARETARTQVVQTQMQNLQQRGQTEITRRIGFLNDLAVKIDALKKISDTDKASLKLQVQQQVDGLTVLSGKINADTDITTLKADVKSIVSGYYIFAFFRVKISLLVAAERLDTAYENMDTIYNKLQTRVADLNNKGENVANLEAQLSDMRKKLDDAKLQFQDAENTLNQLEAKDYPKNKTSLTSARSKIKLGATSLRNAFKVVSQVRLGLGKLGDKMILNKASGSATVNN